MCIKINLRHNDETLLIQNMRHVKVVLDWILNINNSSVCHLGKK